MDRLTARLLSWEIRAKRKVFDADVYRYYERFFLFIYFSLSIKPSEGLSRLKVNIYEKVNRLKEHLRSF